MKKLIILLALVVALTAPPFALTGCQTAPNARVVQVRTLLAVGQSAEGGVALSAQLYRDGKITAAQARAILDFYNLKFQPVYSLAVSAARADLSSLASTDLLGLAAELAALVIQFYPPASLQVEK